MKERELVFAEIRSYLNTNDLQISSEDRERPWGGFFVIDEDYSNRFIELFFPEIDKALLSSGKISPKILMVAPNKKLSWQYHHRRSEIWKLIKGSADVITSYTDNEGETSTLQIGKTITLQKGERHRLVGTHDWGIVAEIWLHTDPLHPSDESDIIRLQDDFGR